MDQDVLTTLKQIEDHLHSIADHLAVIADQRTVVIPPRPARTVPVRPVAASQQVKQRAGTSKITLRSMIIAALQDARDQEKPGLMIPEMRSFIKATYGIDVGKSLDATAWTMCFRLKQIDKDRKTGLYRALTNARRGGSP